MEGQPVGSFGQSIGIDLLTGDQCRGMKRATPVRRQHPIGRIVNQRVLEAVFDVRKQVCLVEEFGILQVLERLAQPIRPQVCHRLQDAERHLVANDSRRLQQALVDQRQPVDAGGQQGFDRLGYLEFDDRGRGAIVGLPAIEHAGLDKGAHALLQEQGCPAGFLDEDFLELSQRFVDADQRIEQFVRNVVLEGIDPDAGEIGLAGPVVMKFGPEADQDHDPRTRKTIDEAVDQGQRLLVDRVEVLEHEQQWPHLAFTEQQPLDGFEDPLPVLRPVRGGRMRVVR